jgi:hypothetical protein
MRCNKQWFSIVAVLFVAIVPSSSGALDARDADNASIILAAAHTAKQKCINLCRDRYRACFSLKQIPSFECRGFYQDCVRYSCTGLGPG